MLKSSAGSYCLELYSKQPVNIQIGKHVNFSGKKGYYYYIGSAFGPGGLRSRIAHHCRPSARPHWHIDYIKSVIPIVAVAYTYEAVKKEHQWADILFESKDLTVLPGIGASDCRCDSHFFFSPHRQETLANLLNADYLPIEKLHDRFGKQD